MFFMVLTMNAAKANTAPTLVKQADGTSIIVCGHGDEHFSWYTTIEGALLYHEGNDFFMAYVTQHGELQSSGILAHEVSERTAAEQVIANSQDRQAFYRTATKRLSVPRTESVPSPSRSIFPHTGSPKVAVILADFSDAKFAHDDATTKNIFDAYLNADGAPSVGDETIDNTQRLSNNHGSVKKYFKDMSYGQFTPQFDVYGPVHLTNDTKHYGEGNDYMSRFIPDVCAAANDEIDYSQYDANGDGYVDLVYVVYAGYSASFTGNSSDCLWPKSGVISGGTYDGVQVYRYGINGELNGNAENPTYINGIGLFCHEFSHCLGLYDLYPTSASAQVSNQGMEDFSIMDGGEYVSNGYCPTAYTAWEREAMGWLTIEELTEAQEVKDVLPLSQEGAKAYRIRNTQEPDGKEYYMLENIQNEGWNAKLGKSGLRPHGLMITHVDNVSSLLTSNTINSTKGHPRMTVIPANGNLASSYVDDDYRSKMVDNLFPGTTGATSFLYAIDGYPNPIVYYGTADVLAESSPVLDIKEEDGKISFTYIKADELPDPVTAALHIAVPTPSVAYDLQGRRVTNTDNHGVYIINGKKVIK